MRTQAPDMLRIVGGEIVCIGEHRTDYLAAWQRKLNAPDETPVCVIRRDDLQALYDELLMQRECILCA